MQLAAGTVVSLWRYPVKSMQGEELSGAAVTARGIAGDRAYALVDRETGLVASAKHPRKWGRLFECAAAFVEPPRPGDPPPPVRITLPDGEVVDSREPDVDRVLSRVLGREVRLTTEAPARAMREADRTPVEAEGAAEVINREDIAVAAPPGTFFDYGVLHLLTTGTLDRLGELYPGGRFEARRFRPNLVVAPTDTQGFVENGWLGRRLSVGAEVRLDAIDPTPRCVVTTLAQDGLPRDPGILRTLARHTGAASATLAPGVVFPAVAGIYASVLREGVVRRGDPILVG